MEKKHKRLLTIFVFFVLLRTIVIGLLFTLGLPLLMILFSFVVQSPQFGSKGDLPSGYPSKSSWPSSSPKSAYASSILPPQAGYSYSPEKSIDGNKFTWWSPNGTYHGQWIVYELERPMEVFGVEILNGSHYPDYSNGGIFFGDLYYQNAILTSATLEFSDGSKRNVEFRIYDGMQTVEFPPKITTHIKLLCTGVFPGQRWQDVCISEIGILGRNVE